MMREFSDLSYRARILPDRIRERSSYRGYSLSNFFCSCLPFVIPSHRINEQTNLIQLVAEGLMHYTAKIETKKNVLVGIYLYVWQNYQDPWQQWTNNPFLDILSEDMEVKSMKEMDHQDMTDSLKALREFCTWVYRNQMYTELSGLYKAFPADIMGRIGDLISDLPSKPDTIRDISNFFR